MRPNMPHARRLLKWHCQFLPTPPPSNSGIGSSSLPEKQCVNNAEPSNFTGRRTLQPLEALQRAQPAQTQADSIFRPPAATRSSRAAAGSASDKGGWSGRPGCSARHLLGWWGRHHRSSTAGAEYLGGKSSGGRRILLRRRSALLCGSTAERRAAVASGSRAAIPAAASNPPLGPPMQLANEAGAYITLGCSQGSCGVCEVSGCKPWASPARAPADTLLALLANTRACPPLHSTSWLQYLAQVA